jgi:hypothetical protein
MVFVSLEKLRAVAEIQKFLLDVRRHIALMALQYYAKSGVGKYALKQHFIEGIAKWTAILNGGLREWMLHRNRAIYIL